MLARRLIFGAAIAALPLNAASAADCSCSASGGVVVAAVQGDVRVAGHEGFTSARSGSTLQAGARLSTGAKGSAKLVAEGCDLAVGPEYGRRCPAGSRRRRLRRLRADHERARIRQGSGLWPDPRQRTFAAGHPRRHHHNRRRGGRGGAGRRQRRQRLIPSQEPTMPPRRRRRRVRGGAGRRLSLCARPSEFSGRRRRRRGRSPHISLRKISSGLVNRDRKRIGRTVGDVPVDKILPQADAKVSSARGFRPYSEFQRRCGRR